ncbi:MAG TPA: sulfurtransferase, partial [Rhodospirillaceae bacterium]|nr:sulfurtransferase [Rhodospirillaceae bacterium]
MASPSEITVSQLSRLIGTPNAPVLIDARAEEAYREDPFLIPGAVWHSPDDIAALEYQLKDARAVVYCVKGFKFSQGAAAILRANGVAAEYLSGGIVAWRENQAPLVPVEKIPPRNAQGQTVWVTRHRPKIDRIACPWLIRRFVDPNAQFLFVAPSEVLNVADK